jgi:putative sterol carrier protein
VELDFMSDAWLQALNERSKESKNYKAATKDWKTTFTLALIPEADKNIEGCGIVLDLAGGEIAKAQRIPGAGPFDGDYVIRGTAEKWKSLLTKEIFPVPALMKGELQLVKGGTTALMMKMGAAQALLDEAGAVPTKWPG